MILVSECLDVCSLQLLQHLSSTYNTSFVYLCRWNETDKKSKSISFSEDSIHDRANDFSGRNLWKESLLEWWRSCPSLPNIEYIRTSGKLISLECAMIDSLQTVALVRLEMGSDNEQHWWYSRRPSLFPFVVMPNKIRTEETVSVR